MKAPKKFELAYDDLLDVIAALWTDALSYKSVQMNDTFKRIMSTRQKFVKISKDKYKYERAIYIKAPFLK